MLRVLLAAAVGVLVVLSAGAVAWSGLVIPRVDAGHARGYGYVEDTGIIVYAFTVTNHGSTPAEVIGVGRPGPGLEPVPLPDEAVEEPTNQVGPLGPGEHMWVAVAYRVTDCDAVPKQSWPVPVRLARPWGVYTTWIDLPPQSGRDFPLPQRQRDDASRPWQDTIEWQRNLADAACHYGAGGLAWVEPDDTGG